MEEVQVDKRELSLAMFEVCESGTLQDLEQLLAQLPEGYQGEWLWNIRDKTTNDTLLHVAITHRNADLVVKLVEMGADVNRRVNNCAPLHTVLHTFTLPGNAEGALRSFNAIRVGADLQAKDDLGMTAAHTAAYFGLHEPLALLLEQAKKLVDSRDRAGNKPLHIAARANSAECIQLLIAQGASLDAANLMGQTALHAAASFGRTQAYKLLVQAGAKEDLEDFSGQTARAIADTNHVLDASRPNFTTSLLTHRLCQLHFTAPPMGRDGPPPPPENIGRLQVLLNEHNGALRTSELALDWNEDCRKACVGDVLRVHEWSYVRKLQHTTEQLGSDPFTSAGIGQLDGDTTLSSKSFDAALFAAGSVCQAVDQVMEGTHRNAFCAVRPPGHHAGPRGLVTSKNDPNGSHGFCLLNNVAVAAAYAKSVYRHRGIRKVVIVDFDVHHGNGTEEIVRWLVPGVDETAIESPFAYGVMKSPRYKPWMDHDDPNNVLFVSVHGYGPRARNVPAIPGYFFYPGSGETQYPTDDQLAGQQEHAMEDLQSNSTGTSSAPNDQAAADAAGNNEAELGDSSDDDSDYNGGGHDEDDGDNSSDDVSVNMPRAMQPRLSPVDRMATLDQVYSSDGSTLILDVGVSLPGQEEELLPGTYRKQWRDGFRFRILPMLREFDPDLIFISAGFDAHRKDEINCGYISLIEEDYEWITLQLARLANSCCDGRLVSVLEGGYNLTGGIVSPFARSVKSHVSVLNAANHIHEQYDPTLYEKESAREQEILEERESKRQQKLAEQQAKAEETLRLMLAARQAAAAEALDAAGEAQSAASTEHPAESTIDDADAAGRKRRRAPVDYVALARKLEEDKQN